MVDNLTTRIDCDPSLEDCSIYQNLKWPEQSPTDLYIYAGVSLANAILPTLYYNVSTDYEGKYVDDDDDEDDEYGNLEVVKRDKDPRKVKQPRVRDDDGDGRRRRGRNRRGRGQTDDSVWSAISGMHSTFGGLSVMFFGLSMAGVLRGVYKSYIEYWMSNLMPAIYLFSLIGLTVDAAGTSDAQGFLETVIYALMFPGAFLFMEMIHGVGALKFLDPNYPYNDELLLPSLMYKFGLAEHTDRMHTGI